MQCHNCGKEVANGAKFCKYCGSRLTEKQESSDIAEKQDVPEEGEDKEASETVKQEALDITEKQESSGAVEDEQAMPSKERNAASEKRKASPIVLISAAVGLVVLLFLTLFLTSFGSGINLNKYMSLETEGYEGYGKTKLSIDWDAIEKKYASKMSFTEAAKEEYGMFLSMMSPVEILRENVRVEVDKSSDLSNGDELKYTWHVNEERINKYVKCKLKWKDGEYKVSSLKKVEKMDAFSGLGLQFSGIAPNGEVRLQYNGKGIDVSDFRCDKTSELENGDIVTVTLSEDAIPKLVESYGMVPQEMKKQYTVSGLDKYISKTEEIDPVTIKALQDQAWDEYQEYMANSWSKEASLESFDYLGTYLLTNKSKEEWEQNRLYLVYRVKSRINYSGSYGNYNQVNDIYWFISFPNLILKANGKVEVEDILNGSTPLSTFDVDSGLSDGWFGTLKWTYYGFGSLESLYKSAVTANLSSFNHEDHVEESGINQDSANASSSPESSAEANGAVNSTSSTKESAAPEGSAPESSVASKINEAGNGGYILPDSDKRLIGREDLMNLSPEQCKIARNEIYARHGRKFKDAALQSYFDSCPWYSGRIEPDSFSDSYLSEVEKKNRDAIVAFEQEMGYNKR